MEAAPGATFTVVLKKVLLCVDRLKRREIMEKGGKRLSPVFASAAGEAGAGPRRARWGVGGGSTLVVGALASTPMLQAVAGGDDS